MISLAQWHVPSKTDSLATLLWSYVHPIRPGRRRNMECTNLLHGLWMSVSYFFHLPKLWAMALMECLYQSHPSRDHIGSFPSFILNHGSRRSSHLRWPAMDTSIINIYNLHSLRLRLGNLWVETYLHFSSPGCLWGYRFTPQIWLRRPLQVEKLHTRTYWSFDLATSESYHSWLLWSSLCFLDEQ